VIVIKIMSVDFGLVRTGLAVCDESEILASPVAVITGTGKALAQKIKLAAFESKAALLVVGHPVNMDGTKGESAQKCAAFAQTLKNVTGLDAVLWDERLTTVSAHRVLNETNVRGKERRATVDAVAAVMILEDYLRYRKNQGATTHTP